MKISEIANLAKVSTTAVSFALNGKPGISDKTRQKILDIVEKNGYSSNRIVKATKFQNKAILLCMGSRTQITTFDPSIASFFSEFLRVIEKKITEAGYMLWLKTVVAPDDLNDSKVAEMMEKATGTILIATDLLPEDVNQMMAHSKNMVVIDSLFPTLNCSCVVQDNYYGTYIATKHLINLGHKRIGYIGTEDQFYNCVQRRLGFRDALCEYNISPCNEFTYFVDSVMTKAVVELKEKLLSANDSPTAYVAESDYLAISLIQCLQEKGIRVPEDVSVIGYDNIQLSEYMNPALTTVNMPKEKIVDAALSLLLNMINNTSAFHGHLREIIIPELVLRDTCLPPQNSDA